MASNNDIEMRVLKIEPKEEADEEECVADINVLTGAENMAICKIEPKHEMEMNLFLTEDHLLDGEVRNESVNQEESSTNEDQGIKMLDESHNLPENVLSRAAKAIEAIEQKNSKSVYEKEYVRFEHWMETNSVKIINETVMLGYFHELSESFSPNSLWTKFSMLRKELIVKNKIKSFEKFMQLQAYLKQLQKGYLPKKSKVLTREQILKFLAEAPDSQYLMDKVALLMGIFGACRRDELVRMQITDVRDVGHYVSVDIPVTKNDKSRSFIIIEESEMNALKLIRKYISLRPTKVSDGRFFLCLRGNRCISQPVGKNTIGSIPCKIAKYLGLPKATEYTGHCLRRTSATLQSDARGSMTNLMKSQSVTKEYIDDSHSSEQTNACLVAGVRASTSTSTYSEVATMSIVSNTKNESIVVKKHGSMGESGINFSGNFHNCSFYFKE